MAALAPTPSPLSLPGASLLGEASLRLVPRGGGWGCCLAPGSAPELPRLPPHSAGELRWAGQRGRGLLAVGVHSSCFLLRSLFYGVLSTLYGSLWASAEQWEYSGGPGRFLPHFLCGTGWATSGENLPSWPGTKPPTCAAPQRMPLTLPDGLCPVGFSWPCQHCRGA